MIKIDEERREKCTIFFNGVFHHTLGHYGMIRCKMILEIEARLQLLRISFFLNLVLVSFTLTLLFVVLVIVVHKLE